MSKSRSRLLNNTVVYVLIAIAIFVFILNFTSKSEPWQNKYNQELKKGDIKGEHLALTNEFDFEDPQVQELIKNIKDSTTSARGALKKTLSIVLVRVKYSGTETIGECVLESASDVLNKGKGDCVSMMKLDVAILRGLGIAARPAGGCLSKEYTCLSTFAIIPLKKPPVTKLVPGDFKKRGYFHEWFEVWLPNYGWLLVDPTSGEILEQECQDYLFYRYDSTPMEMCVIEDMNFWNTCKAY